MKVLQNSKGKHWDKMKLQSIDRAAWVVNRSLLTAFFGSILIKDASIGAIEVSLKSGHVKMRFSL